MESSMKCHPDLAGRGIKYSWGQAKSVYQWAKLSDKKGEKNFEALIKNYLSTEEGVGKRPCSKYDLQVLPTSETLHTCLLLG